jgi:hypothetical protein
MPTPTTYSYTISTDFPGGAVNVEKLENEIQTSSIVTALDGINVAGDSIDINFKDALSTADKTTLDNDVIGPAGGLIAAHDNTASQPIEKVEINNSPIVIPRKSASTSRVYSFSPNWCDKTTWYSASERVFEESVGTGDGSTTIFALANSNVIDLSHGKITDENLIAAPSAASGETPDPTDWKPIVKVNGNIQTERTPFAASGGDYVLDYSTGQITFATAPANSEPIVATYSYCKTSAGSSAFDFGPPPEGKKWTIDLAEAQFSKDLVITDSIFYAPFIGETQVAPATVYKTAGNFLDFTFGSYPIVPSFGGSPRGLTQDTIILRWEYLAPIVLPYSMGLKIRVWLENDTEFNGERATSTMYAFEESE